MTTTPTIHDIDRCRVTIIDEVLGTWRMFELPTTVAEAVHNCFEIEAARFFMKMCGIEDGGDIFLRDHDQPEPIAVSITERSDSITVRWFAVGPAELAVERRKEIINGQWIRKGVSDED